MKEWDLLEAMTAVDDRYLAEAEAAPASPARRKPWLRPALIAACLCLLLVGTAVAAVAVKAAKKMELAEALHVEFVNDEGLQCNRTFLEIENGIAYIPVDMISDNIWELIGQEEWCMPVFASFDSWSEGEKFIDLEFADNDILEKAKKGTVTIVAGPGSKKGEGHCVLRVSGSLKAPVSIDLDAKYYNDPTGKYDQEIQYKEYKVVVDPSGTYEIERVELPPMGHVPVRVHATIATENAYQSDAGQQFLLEGEETVEKYTTPSGLEAFILLHLYDENAFYYSAIFSLNGARFTVNIDGEGKDHQLYLDLTKQILDSFL